MPAQSNSSSMTEQDIHLNGSTPCPLRASSPRDQQGGMPCASRRASPRPPIGVWPRVGLGAVRIRSLSAFSLTPNPTPLLFAQLLRPSLRSAPPPYASVFEAGCPRPLRGLGERSSAGADFAKGGGSAHADTRRWTEFPLDSLPPTAGRRASRTTTGVGRLALYLSIAIAR